MAAPAFDALHDIALLIAAETELDRILERVLRSVESLLGAQSSSVFLPSTDGGPGRRFTTIRTGVPHWEDRPINIRPGGLTDMVLRQGRSVAVEDLRKFPNPSPRLLELDQYAILTAPLRCQSDVIGVLYANFADARRFDDDDRKLIETLGAYAATALRNADLLAGARRAAERQSALLEMARSIGASTSLRNVAYVVCACARELLGSEDASMHLVRPDGLIQSIAGESTEPGMPKIVQPWAPDAFLRRVIAHRTPDVTIRPAENPSTTPVVVSALRGVEAALVAPLVAEDECLGLLIMCWRRSHAITPDELELAETIARQATLALQADRAHEAAIEAARLEGAVKTAQAAAHELSQPLAVVVGYSELLGDAEPDEMRRFAGLIGKAANVAVQKLDRFRNVMRFVELRFGSMDPILDVERSSRESA